MTCADDPAAEFEFIRRPYPYPRQPFQMTSGELVQFETRFFSMPAYGLLADKRLFTPQASHPITADDIKVYINKDAGIAPTVEPTLGGEEYLTATPHYVDYITDFRTLLTEIFALHATDSDWSSLDFLHAHLDRARATYPGVPCCGANLDNSSADDIPDGLYVHPVPVVTMPSGATPPGSSGSIPPPGDGFELGAQQIMDVDIDEIQYQPMIRPTKLTNGLLDAKSIPFAPIFPAVFTAAGAAPTENSIDATNYLKLGLGVSSSGGGALLTGDALVGGPQTRNASDPNIADLTDPSIKFMTGSGQIGAAEGAYRQDIPWALYPAEKELCEYYTPDTAINTINASGRQALFDLPAASLTNNTVLLLNVSEAGSSGQLVSNYPANYHATSGIDANGHAHGGVHICNKLIYNLNSGPAIGFSPVNGMPVYGHYIGTEAGSKGESWAGAGPKYANGDTLYGAGGLVLAFDGTDFSTVNWATTNNTFSPISWAELRTSALGPARGIFGAGNAITFGVSDIIAGSDRGVVTYKQYARWGFIDQIVVPDLDRAQGGQRKREIVSFTTHEYKEGKTPGGAFFWEEVENSPSTHNTQFVYYADTYFVNNIVSFFFRKKVTNGFVHANGDVYQQWSQRTAGNDILPRNNLFAPIGQPTFRRVPLTTRSEVIISIGWFPSWARRRYVTTNNQITVPDQVEFSPAKSLTLTFSDDLFAEASDKDAFTCKVNTFGAPVWDPDAGVNYLYFLWIDFDTLTSKLFFAHMNTDFEIIRMNQITLDGGSAVLFGRPALLSI